MAHFAKVEDNIVTQIIVADQSIIDTFPDRYQWIQTSYNTLGGVHYGPDRVPDGGEALRMNYASIGGTYDLARDAFIFAKPFASWTLNDATCLWEAPIPMPDDGKIYNWDEDSLSWIELPNE